MLKTAMGIWGTLTKTIVTLKNNKIIIRNEKIIENLWSAEIIAIPFNNTKCLTFIRACMSKEIDSEAFKVLHQCFNSSKNQKVIASTKEYYFLSKTMRFSAAFLFILPLLDQSLKVLLKGSIVKLLHDVWVKFGAGPGVKWGLTAMQLLKEEDFWWA